MNRLSLISSEGIVTINSHEIDAFRRSWPCSGIADNVDLIVAFFNDGDLIDYECCDVDDNVIDAGIDSGAAMSALLSSVYHVGMGV